jgi:hypothetical protein
MATGAVNSNRPITSVRKENILNFGIAIETNLLIFESG